MELEEAKEYLKIIKQQLLEEMSVADDWASLGEGYLGAEEDDEKQVEAIEVVLKELDKKDKVIDKMVEDIYDYELSVLEDNSRGYGFESIEEIKQHFYKKVEEQEQ